MWRMLPLQPVSNETLTERPRRLTPKHRPPGAAARSWVRREPSSIRSRERRRPHLERALCVFIQSKHVVTLANVGVRSTNTVRPQGQPCFRLRPALSPVNTPISTHFRLRNDPPVRWRLDLWLSLKTRRVAPVSGASRGPCDGPLLSLDRSWTTWTSCSSGMSSRRLRTRAGPTASTRACSFSGPPFRPTPASGLTLCSTAASMVTPSRRPSLPPGWGVRVGVGC